MENTLEKEAFLSGLYNSIKSIKPALQNFISKRPALLTAGRVLRRYTPTVVGNALLGGTSTYFSARGAGDTHQQALRKALGGAALSGGIGAAGKHFIRHPIQRGVITDTLIGGISSGLGSGSALTGITSGASWGLGSLGYSAASAGLKNIGRAYPNSWAAKVLSHPISRGIGGTLSASALSSIIPTVNHKKPQPTVQSTSNQYNNIVNPYYLQNTVAGI